MMASIKRKTLETQLQRRVRARRHPSEEPSDTSNGDDSLPRPHEQTSHLQVGQSKDLNEDKEVDLSISDNEEDDESTASEEVLAPSISFGVLAKAQANLHSRADHPGSTTSGRSRIEMSVDDDTWQDNEALERKAGRKDHRDFNRSSKHAPTELSSKKAVSRRREVVPVIKRQFRDPRFEALSGPLDESKAQMAYSFLDDYREDEMKELRIAIKKAKDETEKEKLKRALLSMESKKKAEERKRREAEILSRHRTEEKELVKQGKKPFYLKKSERQKRVLIENYGQLKGKQLDHVIERRRRKLEQRDKKKLPWARREVPEKGN